MKAQQRTWEIVEAAKSGDKASRIFDISILSLIALNVVAVIIGSVQSIQNRWGSFLNTFEIISVMIFSIEYLTRLWSCSVDPRYGGGIRGRIRYAIRAMSIIDLLAILPFYLPFVGIDLRSLRVLRLLRIIRIAKVGRYYSSLNLIKHVFKTKKEELVLSFLLMLLLLIVSSSLLYYCESSVQPEAFRASLRPSGGQLLH